MGFNIHVFNGENPQQQYDALAEKDSNTLYLLASGKGYLGSFMLFNSDSNIDFSDIEQVKEKLTYTEKDEEGNDIVYSSIISSMESNPLVLHTEDVGLGILTDETMDEYDETIKPQFDEVMAGMMETGQHPGAKIYEDHPYLLSMLPTWYGLINFVDEYVNKKLEGYVTATVQGDDEEVVE